MEFAAHLEELAQSYEAALAQIATAAQAAHARIDGDLEALAQLSGTGRPALIRDVPIDEPPPYVPPPSAAAPNALIPDTPLVDAPAAGASSIAFDDAPLWQS
jgi:hypothetical protein